MQSTTRLIVMAGVLALVFARAAAAPLAARWEGFLDGRQAVWLELVERPAAPSLPVSDPRWDGRLFFFAVEVGGRRVELELRAAGAGKALLHRLAAGDLPETAPALSAIR